MANSVNDLNLHVQDSHAAESLGAEGLLAYLWEVCSIYAPICGTCVCQMKLVSTQCFNCVNTDCAVSKDLPTAFKYATENVFSSYFHHLEHRIKLYAVTCFPPL